MRTEIDNECVKCINDLYEYVDTFEIGYKRLQKNHFNYIFEKYGTVNEVDYHELHLLRNEISSKIHTLKQEIRKILEKILRKGLCPWFRYTNLVYADFSVR